MTDCPCFDIGNFLGKAKMAKEGKSAKGPQNLWLLSAISLTKECFFEYETEWLSLEGCGDF